MTGASRGTGVDIARALASAGAQIAVHYRTDRAAAATLAASLRAGGAGAEIFGADVARSDEVRRLVAEVQTRLGPARWWSTTRVRSTTPRFGELAETDWDYVMSANLKAVYLTAQLVAPAMRRAGWGRIVNIGATSGLVRSHGVYGLAKAALLPLTQALAAGAGARDHRERGRPEPDREPADRRHARLQGGRDRRHPPGRLVTQQEIGQMVVRLCSSEFDFVTGQAIVVDGGRTIPRFPRLDISQE